jgi:dihydrofolate reductase
MRRIIAMTISSLDGFIDEPHLWSLTDMDEALEQRAMETAQGADALLFGRITYDGMAQAWPTRSGDPFSDHVNAIPKYVVASKPVDTDAWSPTTVIPGDELIPAVTALKEEDGGDILTWGSGRLTDALTQAGLLDEHQIRLHPVLKGDGERLFRPESTAKLELLGCESFSNGALLLRYGVLGPA